VGGFKKLDSYLLFVDSFPCFPQLIYYSTKIVGKFNYLKDDLLQVIVEVVSKFTMMYLSEHLERPKGIPE
jgi:hypothetical protein